MEFFPNILQQIRGKLRNTNVSKKQTEEDEEDEVKVNPAQIPWYFNNFFSF
jgi:hypothetical protein